MNFTCIFFWKLVLISGNTNHHAFHFSPNRRQFAEKTHSRFSERIAHTPDRPMMWRILASYIEFGWYKLTWGQTPRKWVCKWLKLTNRGLNWSESMKNGYFHLFWSKRKSRKGLIRHYNWIFEMVIFGVLFVTFHRWQLFLLLLVWPRSSPVFPMWKGVRDT